MRTHPARHAPAVAPVVVTARDRPKEWGLVEGVGMHQPAARPPRRAGPRPRALGPIVVLLGVLFAVLVLATGARPAAAATIDPPAPPSAGLELYRLTGPPGTAGALVADGYDVVARRPDGDLETVDVTLTGRQLSKVRSAGYLVRPVLDPQGRSALAAAAAQAEGGYRVWTPYSGPGGIAERLRALVRDHPRVAHLERLGTSVGGRPILAVRVTDRVRHTPAGSRPAVLYTGLRDARGWVAGEVVLHLLTEATTKGTDLHALLPDRELWFVPVLNPDGYDRTFTAGERLWSKNLRDNDGDGRVGPNDGVDLAHNFATRFAQDAEGSSPEPGSQAYRGPTANSEPETRALDGLLRRVHFTYSVDYGAYGGRLLFPSGWQSTTATTDDPAYRALAGDDEHPAIPGYDVGLIADQALSNGDPRDHAHRWYGTLAWRVDLDEGCAGCGFVFPDDPAAVAAEVERNRAFALDLAASAGRADDPVSHLGAHAPALLARGFATSAGSPQPVEVVAARRLGAPTAHWRVAGGPERAAPATPAPAGERYGAGYNAVYKRWRAVVTDAAPGASVEVWFTAGADRSPSFTYRVADDVGGDVLILAAEDVTGASPPQAGGRAHYAGTYADALTAAGYTSDVYDVDAAGRVPPDPLGVLAHYRAVVWETGDDVVPRFPGQPAGTASRLAVETMLAVREYLNAGGRLLLTGAYAGFGESRNGGFYYGPGARACRDREHERCLPLVDDFLQYWLGVARYVDDEGAGTEGALALSGTAGGPFDGLRASLLGAGAQSHTAGFLAAGPPSAAASAAPLRWDDGSPAPLAPPTGTAMAWSGRGEGLYARLTRTVDLRGRTGGTLTFRTSYDLDRDWDHLFVEARTPGGDDWTTLPVPGRTSTDPGPACAADVLLGTPPRHPELRNYQGPGCRPVGRTGRWNAATGRSAGWEDWTVDLTRFAGREVELSITTETDGPAARLGAFVDDVAVAVDGAPLASTSFEPPSVDPTGAADGWAGTWTRTPAVFGAGAAVVTPATVYLGFGLEDLPATRPALLRTALGLLLRPPEGSP